MKLLFVDVNGEHSNVMWKNYRNALNSEFDIEYYGPGYVSESSLDDGLEKYIDSRGGFDIIIVSSYLLDSNVMEKRSNIWTAYWLHRYLLPNYELCEAVRYSISIVNALKRIKDIPRIILLQRDVADLSEEAAEELIDFLEAGFYIMGWGLQFSTPQMDVKKEEMGCFQINTRYRKICENFYRQIISVPPVAINEANICMTSLGRRECDWIVPGNLVGYPHRQQIFEYLKCNGHDIWDKDRLRSEFIYRKSKVANLTRIKYRNLYDAIVDNLTDSLNFIVPSQVPRKELCMYREKHLEGLRMSRYAYVDGSVARFFNAKYAEIPASGALMVGETCYGLKEMGFVPGIHMVEASVETIGDIIAYINDNPEKIQTIAWNAQKLVIQKHTFRNRAKSIKISCEKILAGTFGGSHWENGDYIVDELK